MVFSGKVIFPLTLRSAAHVPASQAPSCLPWRYLVLNLRLPNLDLISRNAYHFAIAPNGNGNPVTPMFGDRFGHSLPKGFFGSVCEQGRSSFPLSHFFPSYFTKLLKRTGSSSSILPDSWKAIILGTSPELSKIVHESANGL